MPERLTASRASKHVACAASANLELAIPGYQPPPDQGKTVASEKGDRMHKLLEDAGQFTPKEMLAVAEAIQYVARLRQTRRFKVENEAKLSGWWLDSEPPCYADVLLWVADEVHVIDYKFGKIPVMADDNPQGKYYALAALNRAPNAKGVWFHIVQPLIGNIVNTYFTKEELLDFMNETAQAEKRIAGGDTTFSPGDHCTFCPANPASRGGKGSRKCPAMIKMLYPQRRSDDEILAELNGG